MRILIPASLLFTGCAGMEVDHPRFSIQDNYPIGEKHLVYKATEDGEKLEYESTKMSTVEILLGLAGYLAGAGL